MDIVITAATRIPGTKVSPQPSNAGLPHHPAGNTPMARIHVLTRATGRWGFRSAHLPIALLSGAFSGHHPRSQGFPSPL